MRIFSTITFLTLFVTVTAGRAPAADVTEAELMQGAIELGRQYDANYANKNPAAVAALYAPDGLLVSPSSPIVRGSIVTIYQRDPDGWHMRLVEPSVPEPAAK